MCIRFHSNFVKGITGRIVGQNYSIAHKIITKTGLPQPPVLSDEVKISSTNAFELIRLTLWLLLGVEWLVLVLLGSSLKKA